MAAKSWADGCVAGCNWILVLPVIIGASYFFGWGGFVFGLVVAGVVFGVSNQASRDVDEKLTYDEDADE